MHEKPVRSCAHMMRSHHRRPLARSEFDWSLLPGASYCLPLSVAILGSGDPGSQRISLDAHTGTKPFAATGALSTSGGARGGRPEPDDRDFFVQIFQRRHA